MKGLVQQGLIGTVPAMLQPAGYQQISAPAASTALTVPAGAVLAIIQCTAQAIRWRDDGVAPTAAIGMNLAVNTPLTYAGDLAALRVIQVAASAVVDISYYKPVAP